MAIVVEDGTVVAGANSYITRASAIAYAAARGVTLANTDATDVLIVKAFDYLESMRSQFKGELVEYDQPAAWPRAGATIEGYDWSSDEIPRQVIAAQCALVVEINAGEDPFNPTAVVGPGKRAGLDGERSGLWREYARIIGIVRPRYIVVENVAALAVRGLLGVLGDLTEMRYDAEWCVLGADALGASQHRERLWLLAYPDHARLQGPIWVWQPLTTRDSWTTSYREPLRSNCGYWPPGPRAVDDIPRMADGPANRVDRLRALGNGQVSAVVVRAWQELYGRLVA